MTNDDITTREIISLYLEGYAVETIAELLNVSVARVICTYRDARIVR